jgi:hypothetical protein
MDEEGIRAALMESDDDAGDLTDVGSQDSGEGESGSFHFCRFDDKTFRVATSMIETIVSNVFIIVCCV